MALGCAQPFGVLVEEVSQRHVSFFTRETVGLLDIPESRRRRNFILTSFVEKRGSQRLPRFTLVVRLDVDRASSECLVAQFQSWLVHAHLGFVFMVLAVARVKSPSMHATVRLCVDVRCVVCHSVCSSGS